MGKCTFVCISGVMIKKRIISFLEYLLCLYHSFSEIYLKFQAYMSYSNIATLTYLAAKPGWEVTSTLNNVST